eukprot:15451682-Alexandrium_andersonii.AAC.1
MAASVIAATRAMLWVMQDGRGADAYQIVVESEGIRQALRGLWACNAHATPAVKVCSLWSAVCERAPCDMQVMDVRSEHPWMALARIEAMGRLTKARHGDELPLGVERVFRASLSEAAWWNVAVASTDVRRQFPSELGAPECVEPPSESDAARLPSGAEPSPDVEVRSFRLKVATLNCLSL